MLKIFLLFSLCLFIRLVGLDSRTNLSWDEVELWYQSLSNFRSAYLAPIPPIITLIGFVISGSTSYYSYHLIIALISALSLIPIYLTCKEVFSEKIAVLSALCFAFSPLAVYYGQEARIYAYVQLFAALYIYGFIKYLNKRSINNLVFFLIVNALGLSTHLIFIYLTISSGLTLLLLDIKNDDKKIYNKVYYYLLAISTLIGLTWIFIRPIHEKVISGIYSKGILLFIPEILLSFSTAQYFKGLFNYYYLIALLVSSVFFLGINLVRKSNYSFFVFSATSISISIAILFFTLGEKAYWPWYRYLNHLLPLFSIIIAVGLSGIFKKIRSKIIMIFLFFILAFPTIINITSPKIINPSVSIAKEDLEIIQGQVLGVLLPQINWGYGDESERPATMYFNSVISNLPTYHIKNNEIQEVKFSNSKYNLTKIIDYKKNTPTKLFPGDYAVYPYNFVQPDGIYGRNKPGCNYIAQLLPDYKIENVKNEGSLIDICRISNYPN